VPTVTSSVARRERLAAQDSHRHPAHEDAHLVADDVELRLAMWLADVATEAASAARAREVH
jgi:hypothetical protein